MSPWLEIHQRQKNERWWGINESVQHKILEIILIYLISIQNYKAQEPHVPIHERKRIEIELKSKRIGV